MTIKLDPGAIRPTKANADDAGFDLYSPIDRKVPARGATVIDTGVHVALPAGTFGKLESRSGLMVKHSVVCPGGVIDRGYTGSIQVALHNHSDRDYWVYIGDRIAQMIVQPYVPTVLLEADELPETDRGQNGIGSTGR